MTTAEVHWFPGLVRMMRDHASRQHRLVSYWRLDSSSSEDGCLCGEPWSGGCAVRDELLADAMRIEKGETP